MQILHLEDSRNDATLIEAVLRGTWPDCRIELATSRAEYERALARPNYDLILSDYALPEFDGLAALRLAKERCPHAPFLFVSGTIGEERAIEALKNGAVDYVVKDRPARLVPAIRHALAFVQESARRRASEELARQSNERLQLVARASNDAVWDWNPATGALWWSEGYEVMFGHPRRPNSTLQDSWVVFLHPDDSARVQATLFAAIKSPGEAWQEEYRFRRADGTYADVFDRGYVVTDEQGKGVRMLGSVLDITRRKQAEKQIRDQAELLNKSRDAIMLTDANDRVTFWNRSAERITGWRSAEVLGRMIEDVFGTALTRIATEVRATVARNDAWDGEVTIVNRAGDPVTLEMRITQVRDAVGRPNGRLSVCTDITERKLLELEVRRAERLDSIGMLAGGIAHDLNNAFAPILMAIDLLRLRLTEPHDVQLLESVAQSADHGAALVKQLLAFARGNEVERSVVQVRELMRVVEKLLRSNLPSGMALQVSAAPDVWPVLGGATELKQVLINLGLNARDAMPQGGVISLHADNVVIDQATAAARPGAQAGPHVRLAVTDTGMGIPPELLQRIFDPFFTTKPASKGTGLGLSMVQGIVRSHGGFMRVDSRPGEGARFELFLPAQLEKPAAPCYSPLVPEAPRSKGRILLLEDDDAVRQTFELLLKQAGYHVTAVVDGPSGLEAFRRDGDFDVVLSDLLMPGMSGIEVIAAIRVVRPRQPAVVLSGLIDAGTRAELNALHPKVLCLAKPVSSDVLLRAFQHVLAQPA